jgi:hypothetical protein
MRGTSPICLGDPWEPSWKPPLPSSGLSQTAMPVKLARIMRQPNGSLDAALAEIEKLSHRPSALSNAGDEEEHGATNGFAPAWIATASSG